MRFAFTDEQRLAQDAVRALLAEGWPASQLRARWSEDVAATTRCWPMLARTGVLGLHVPVDHGGAGLNEVDLVLLLEEVGRAALPDPVVETAAVAAPLIAETGSAHLVERYLPSIADGRCVVGVGLTDAGPFVADADIADVCVLQDGDDLHAVERAHLTMVRQPSVDGARRLFAVTWKPEAATLIAGGDDGRHAAALAFDRGCLGVAAELLGLTEPMITMAARHARDREQFGRPIGSFQAVKHELANALLTVEFARPLVYRAAWSVATGSSDRSRDVSMAKAYASQASLTAARVALQVHGAIGYTWEHDLHLWMKRAWALAAAWGDAAWHRDRVAAAVLPSRDKTPEQGDGTR